MTTTNIPLQRNNQSLFATTQTWFNKLWAFNKLLTLSTLLYIVVIPIYIVAAILDPRLITNSPAFIKPLKFILSSAIYIPTFLWMLTLIQATKPWSRRGVQAVANITALGILIENILITMQAIRGVSSHFNEATPFDDAVFDIMGATITLVAFMSLLLGIWLLFQSLPNRTIAWGIRLGVFVSFLGMMVAFLMIPPTPSQIGQIEAGGIPAAVGAHSVGIEDGGPGLPILGWSTVGGDLRVAHFIGLHGMQILPLIGLFLSRRRGLNPRQQLMLMLSAGVAYCGWLGLLTWQALRGQSIVAPDAQTFIAYVALFGIMAIATASALLMMRHPTPHTNERIMHTPQ